MGQVICTRWEAGKMANPELNTVHTQEAVSKAVTNVAKSKFLGSQRYIHDRILVMENTILCKTLFLF